MLNINFLRTEIAWRKANYTEHIPLHVCSRSTPLIIHNIELFLKKLVTIYNNFINIYQIEDFSNKPNISSILIKIKYTQ
jgi:ubiquinone biosynthesis protein Coq4